MNNDDDDDDDDWSNKHVERTEYEPKKLQSCYVLLSFKHEFRINAHGTLICT